jgi:aminopeptidase YwaD
MNVKTLFHKYLHGFIFTFLATQVLAQVEEGKRITKELCSETYFGRGYLKSGDSLAAVFLANEFQKRGLKPLQKSYFQTFSLTVNTFPSTMEVRMDSIVLKPGVDFMVDPSSGSAQCSWQYKYLDKSELFSSVVTNQLVQDLKKTKNWNSVVIDLRGITGDSLKQAKAFQQKLVNSFHLAVVTDEKFTFSVSDEKLNYAYVFIHGNAFQKGALLQTKIVAALKRNHQANNVMAVLPAKKKTKKTLIVSAHYDHLGGMGEYTFFPGGNDNASGTSMLFTLADELKKAPLNYNVLFIAFAGEEAGLVGSKYFVEHPLVSLKDIRFVLNLDIMGSGEEGITVVNATEFPDAFQQLEKINTEKQLLAQVKKRDKAANSDHYWFTENGVPAFFIYTMGPNKNYHDVFDTFEALSFAEYNDLVTLTATFLRSF